MLQVIPKQTKIFMHTQVLILWEFRLPLALASLTHVESEYIERANKLTDEWYNCFPCKLTNEQCKYNKQTTSSNYARSVRPGLSSFSWIVFTVK
jgi:hypothetical protein